MLKGTKTQNSAFMLMCRYELFYEKRTKFYVRILLTNAKLCFFEKQNKKLLSYFPTYLRPNDNMIISKYDDIT